MMPKLHKELPGFRGITACNDTTTEGVETITNAILVGFRPVLHALWRIECLRAGITAKECWITSGGRDIVDALRDLDKRAQGEQQAQQAHHIETFDFVAMYANIPVTSLLDNMEELLTLVFQHQAKEGFKSMYVRCGYKERGQKPVVRLVKWSKHEPVDKDNETKRTHQFYVGPVRLLRWIKFILEEGYVQFGSNMYKQASGIFMGTSPAPDLANDFAFMHELRFLKVLMNAHDQALATGIDSIYPHHFVEQFAVGTKRYIDDILTMTLGSKHNDGPVFEDIITQDGFYGGMYPSHVRDAEGNQVPSPISITKEQAGDTVHFLDMRFLQPKPGTTEIQMYDKREHMESLKDYRRFPHWETKLAKRALFATLHCQLCRFAIRCDPVEHFEVAAAKLIRDMMDNHYDVKFLDGKLYNFKHKFFNLSIATRHVRNVNTPEVRNQYWDKLRETVWARVRSGNFNGSNVV